MKITPGNESTPSAFAPPNTVSNNATAIPGLPTYLEESLGITFTKYLVLGIITLVGIVGNVLVILVSTKRKAFKSSLDLFLKNLAIADLGFLLLVLPPAVVRAEIPFKWPLGEFVCRYLYPSTEIFHGASVWIIVAVAAERYRNIVGMVHVQRRRYSGSRATVITIALAWCLSFVVFCIPMYAMTTYIEGPNHELCTLQFPDPPIREIVVQVYVILMVFFSYIIPLVGIIWTYVAISRQLSRSNMFLRSIRSLMRKGNRKNVAPAARGRARTLTCEGLFGGGRTRGAAEEQNQAIPETDGRRLTQNKRAKKILTPVAITFAVTMLPLNIMRIVVLYWREISNQEYYNILFFITIIFTAANSSLNPILYSIVSLDFRNSLKSLFRRSVERIRSVTSSTFGRASEHDSPIRVYSLSINSNGDSLLSGRRSSGWSESTKC